MDPGTGASELPQGVGLSDGSSIVCLCGPVAPAPKRGQKLILVYTVVKDHNHKVKGKYLKF